MNRPDHFDLAGAFETKHAQLVESFTGIRAATGHPGTIGDHGEGDWEATIEDFLPRRYKVGPIFAVDCHGNISQQIDLGIYDKQYSPQWFGTNKGVRFVPVESVYAAFEVKPTLNKKYVKAAIEKVTSVRTLQRTSAPVFTVNGKFRATDPATKPIIGGILTTKGGWNRDNVSRNLKPLLPAPEDPGFLDIGIAADSIAFDFTPVVEDDDIHDPAAILPITFSAPDQQLIHFAIRLFRQLQTIGTVLAVDMMKYEDALSTKPPSA